MRAVGQKGLVVQAKQDKMGPRWWRKCQRTFSHPSLWLLSERDEVHGGQSEEKRQEKKIEDKNQRNESENADIRFLLSGVR